ncbi:ABC transporter permease subunit [Agrobacterium rubi]|uniref:amino acid ABC transporter permease n=1 Tax=Agrobacterium rubi TaxID=28099 RepID=UPI001574B60D|nr:ABC transporter permease subunit [Agrobacterium rubi]NTF10467.1 ABC transporter permease subunit [Agrobacterium rubi]NTF22861.1 ABC transporter permease subunit [Agrobacterium rubi]NTF29792.1 ABC transporter permease subunit [Agrobacterium rubi]
MNLFFQSLGIQPGWGYALLKGLLVTMQISAGAFLLEIIIGLFIAALRIGKGPLLSGFARAYCTTFRAVPELLLILILFYLGSAALNGLSATLGVAMPQLNGPLVAVMVLGIVQSSYAAEIFRSAIEAIPKGQLEAARAFGMGGLTLYRRVTIPAMAPNALAGMANLWINVIKDSALISVVGTNELLYTARQAAGSTRRYLTFYLLAAALYYLVTLLSNFVVRKLERRIRRGLTGG